MVRLRTLWATRARARREREDQHESLSHSQTISRLGYRIDQSALRIRQAQPPSLPRVKR